MTDKKVVVAGATGFVGNAAVRHFAGAAGGEMVALSRRRPRDLYGARHVPIDSPIPRSDAGRSGIAGATHLIYAALYEART